MSKRMTSETIIFDTEWLTEADFGESTNLSVDIDYQAYDTLKIIVEMEEVDFAVGGLFQEFDVYKLENFGLAIRTLLSERDFNYFEIYHMKDEGYSRLIFYLTKYYLKNKLKGISSIYIKGVKR